MPRIKRHYQAGFTTVSNEFLRDPSLSLSERGLLITMLSLPDGWNMSGRGLASILPNGRDKIFSTLKKLESKGYLKRELIRENGQFVDTEYQFCDSPVFKEENAKKEKQKIKRKELKEKKEKERKVYEKAQRYQQLIADAEKREGKEVIQKQFDSLKGEKLQKFISEKVFEREKIKEDISGAIETYNKIVNMFSEIIENNPEKRSELSLAGPLDMLFLFEKIQGTENCDTVVKKYFLDEGVFLK